MSLRSLRCLGLLVLLAAAPASQPSGVSVSGRVTAATGAALPSEMIVYLEPVDPSLKFPAPVAPAQISQKGARFAPSLLVVSVGETVEFKNDEDRPIEHNVFSRSPVQPFDLGLYRPPTDKSVTFGSPGVVRLYCSIHRLMDGMIYVCPTPFWARVGADGRYLIENVPRGQWRLRTWQRQAKFDERDLAVKTDSTDVNVDLEMSRK
jgi:plastocyanin